MLRLAGLVVIVAAVSVAAVKGLQGVNRAPSALDANATPASLPRSMLVVPEDGRGHFVSEPLVNGVRIQAVVDTGASMVALSAEDAARCGIFPGAGDFTLGVATANGSVKAAPVRLREVRLGSIVLRDVEGLVLPAGSLHGSLLGMSFLRRLSSFEVKNGTLVLTE
jgi:aspartyl protease family protein